MLSPAQKEVYIITERLTEKDMDGFDVEPVCPDCSDALTISYDWDTARYSCENCGILINNRAHLIEES